MTHSDITKIYGIPTSLQGSLQSIALVEYDNFLDSDITTYASLFSLPTPNFQRILINPTCEICCSGTTCSSCSCTLTPPTTPGSGQDEVTLDIQMAIAVAPKAKILVYIGKNSLTVSVINKIAQDNLAKTVSTSWGFTEDAIFPSLQGFAVLENNIFKQMASQGQSFFAATGDHGAFGDFQNNPTKLVIQDPSSQPFVTAVGGTRVTLDSSGNRVSETTWFNAKLTEGGGGGISVFWPLPSYQNSLGTAANKGSTTFRMVPDVSLNADPSTGYLVILNGIEDQFGGTSAAAPLWAAFTCLINEYRATLGLNSIGFLNPTIYPLFQGSQYNSLMNDINDNSNNGFFPAVTGYDLATGWGTFKAQELLLALSVSPTLIPTTKPTNHPTAKVTSAPMNHPTNLPTNHPTDTPTNHPTVLPTSRPTTKPTNHPTVLPTSRPTTKPTNHPTVITTSRPTTKPTNHPTVIPTSRPTTKPTNHPTVIPTSRPTTKLTNHPTANPTNHPTVKPTIQLTTKPTNHPTVEPTNRPTVKPTNHPTDNPSTISTTTKPSIKSTLQPSNVGGSVPTSNPVSESTLSPSKLLSTKSPNPVTSPSFNTSQPTVLPSIPGGNNTNKASSDLAKFPTLEIIIGSSVGGVLLLSAAFLAMRRRGSKDKRPLHLVSENPLYQPQQQQMFSYPNY